MRSGRAFVALTLIAMLAIMLVPSVATHSDAVAENEIGMFPDADAMTINAGQSGSFNLVITNNLENVPNSLSDKRMITINPRADHGTSVSSNETFIILEGKEYKNVVITVDTDKYAATGRYTLSIELEIRNLGSDEGTPVIISQVVEYNIASALSAGDSFNKILGIFDNPLPAPFNDPAFTAAISFILWLMVGLLAFVVVMPVIVHILMRGHKSEGASLVSSTRKLILPIIVLYAISKSLRVYGAPESIVSAFETWFGILYILLGAVIIWKVYTIFVHYSVERIEDNLAELDQGSTGSLEPLFRLLGKLAISVFAVTMMMGTLGFNLTAIITSAGIMSLGITLGAQSVLNQFFSGLVLLLTRPFKADDLVRLGTTPTTYRVIKVDIMNTVFKNWENEETIIMPNNTVATSSIINITRNNMMYKIHVYMTIAYGEDIEKARRIMMNITMNHHRIVKDGTVDMPYTRVTAFASSDIQIRMTAYVDDFNDAGMIEGELRVAMYNAFMDQGINIPYAQLDVHLDIKD